MVIYISEEDLLQMKGVIMDGDKNEPFRFIRVLVERLEQQKRQGAKAHI